MNKKKNMLAGFAIFATMLMLTVSSIAAPVQQKAVMNTSEPKIANDTTTKSTCSLCAQDISTEVSAAITELKTMQKEGLIPPELSEEYAQIMMIASTTNGEGIGCDIINQILWFAFFIISVREGGPHNVDWNEYPFWEWLAEWYYENC
jgi:hypothetical protein